MDSKPQSEWVWPERNGPSDAEKTHTVAPKAPSPHNEPVMINGGFDVTDTGSLVNGMQNGDMAATDSNSKLMSTYSDVECVIQDLPDSNNKYAVSSKLAIHKKALPSLSNERMPNDSGLPVIKEHSPPTYMTPPSSPMLTALRDAVSSLNRMEDFEIIQPIGEGFYAKVYKVISYIYR